MTDNLERTIAALREHYGRWPVEDYAWSGAIYLRVADLLALCDAAEAGLRCPPREPTADRQLQDALRYEWLRHYFPGEITAAITGKPISGSGDILDDEIDDQRGAYGIAPKINGGQEHGAAARCPVEGIAPSEATRLTADASGWMTDAIQRGQLGADAGSTPAPPTINEGGQDAATREEADGAGQPGLVPRPVLPSPDELLRIGYKINCGGTHWEGCWQEHVTCYAGVLRSALRQSQAELAALRADAERVPRERDDHAAYCAGIERELAERTRERDAYRDAASARDRNEDALRAECARLRKDAERYQWLRDRLYAIDFEYGDAKGSVIVFEAPPGPLGPGMALDAAIDKARGG